MSLASPWKWVMSHLGGSWGGASSLGSFSCIPVSPPVGDEGIGASPVGVGVSTPRGTTPTGSAQATPGTDHRHSDHMYLHEDVL